MPSKYQAAELGSQLHSSDSAVEHSDNLDEGKTADLESLVKKALEKDC